MEGLKGQIFFSCVLVLIQCQFFWFLYTDFYLSCFFSQRNFISIILYLLISPPTHLCHHFLGCIYNAPFYDLFVKSLSLQSKLGPYVEYGFWSKGHAVYYLPSFLSLLKFFHSSFPYYFLIFQLISTKISFYCLWVFEKIIQKWNTLWSTNDSARSSD